MKLLKKIEKLPQHAAIRHYFHNNSIFFDIETTGFSPKNSFVYLIGFALRTGEDTFEICQILAENRSEEEAVLTCFYQYLRSVKTILTFHGMGFDIPFLKARESLYKFSADWDSFICLDLYKITSKLSHLFLLPDKKQKSLEQFLGIQRKDRYSGGDLIRVYREYEKQPDPQKENLLLLHNYEDVVHMPKLLQLLTYRDFLETPADVVSAEIHSYRPYDAKADARELLITLKAPAAFPKSVLYRTNLCSLMCREDTAVFSVPVFCGELKFFYDNYQDYYYLPQEDMAVHKSVAVFVDASCRKKATAATCYTRKSGCFLPQPQILFSPCFYPGKKSPVSYFELTDDFLLDSRSLQQYASLLLALCQKNSSHR